jgi:hypothetical protein
LRLDAGRSAKANLSIDAGLRGAIDETAAARGLTRSALLTSVARQKIEKAEVEQNHDASQKSGRRQQKAASQETRES